MAGQRIDAAQMTAAGGDWAGIEQITPTLRIGFANDFILMEKTLPNGDVGVYNLAHIPAEDMESFLAWRASLGS